MLLNNTNFALHFVYIFCFLAMGSYGLRNLGSAHRHLVLGDYLLAYLLSLFYTLIVLGNNTMLCAVTFVVAWLLFFIQWASLISLRYYGIKINFHILKTFSTGVGEFGGETKETLTQLLGEAKLLLLFLFVTVGYVGLFFANFPFFVACSLVFFVFIINLLTKSKLSRGTILLWLLGLVVVGYLSISLLQPLLFTLPPMLYNYLVVGSAIILIGLYLCHFFIKQSFFIVPNLLKQQFRDEKIPLTILHNAPELKQKDLDLAVLSLQNLQPSPLHGTCRNAAIIFITVESLTNYYFSAEQEQQLMPFFSDLKRQGLSSKHHISPSALTNNALRALYAGGYINSSTYPHMQFLQQLGYQTCFVSSQKTSEFNLANILHQIGFTNIIDNFTFTQKKSQRIPDPEFFTKAYDLLIEKVNLQQPFFLHVMNNQTHGPYVTYEKKILDRKQRYYQAIKETDAELQNFVKRITAAVENVLIVYTGDHGESFGEEGYMSHANSVIQPQIQVPFVLHHPKLTPKELDFSCHFDIFPTIFDLLGHRYQYQTVGNSLANSLSNQHCFAYCETRMGNAPSSFAIVTPEQKIYFDRQLAKYQIRDLNDQVLHNFSSEEYNYYLKLLLLGLNERGLVY